MRDEKSQKFLLDVTWAVKYTNWLKNNDCSTVNATSYHFGVTAHRKWAEFLLPYLTRLL